ncbi:MAG: MBL fold metallo-hydrolase, partial [Armatimonadetes bacterium]
MAVKMTFLGHAAWLIESNGTNILIDPFLTGNPVAPKSPEEVSADFILVSHAHGDHLGDSVAIAKRTGATIIS